MFPIFADAYREAFHADRARIAALAFLLQYAPPEDDRYDLTDAAFAAVGDLPDECVIAAIAEATRLLIPECSAASTLRLAVQLHRHQSDFLSGIGLLPEDKRCERS